MFEIIGDSFDFSKYLFSSAATPAKSLQCLEARSYSIIYSKGILISNVYVVILALHTVSSVKHYRLIKLPATVYQAIN